MLSDLKGPKFSCEKRLRSEFGSLGLGSKWKESNKGSASPIFLVQVYTGGFLSVHLFVQGFGICKMKIKHSLMRILFCYNFKKLIVIPTVNN